MKKKFLSFSLAIAIFLTTSFSGTFFTSADMIYTDPLTYANDINFGPRPETLTEDAVSTFTADMKYDYKIGNTVSLQYDVGYPVYFCDFNNGEVIEALHETATVTNTDGKFAIKGDRWTQSANLAENMWNFEMSFDVQCDGAWNNACVYLRGEWLYLQMMGKSTANNITGSTEKRLLLKNRRNNDTVSVDINPHGKHIRVLAVDDNVKVFVGGVLAIDYTYPPNMPPRPGAIYLTNTEIVTTYDNMLICALPYENDDTYYQIDIGAKSTLSRYTNGVAEILCEGDGLSQEKEYSITAKRIRGKVELYADESLLLKTSIPCPDTVECGHIRLLSSASSDTARDVHIYNSTNIKVEESYVEILPTQTSIDPSLAISSQSGTSNDAAITFKDDGTVSVTSPSELNKAVVTTNFLSCKASDVYIRFNVKTNRPDWTYDRYYFAGYTIYCGIDSKDSESPCTAVNPDGKAISCNPTYNYYTHSVYTMEFIRSGYRVAVYYYPKDDVRTLLFEDFCTNQNLTDFYVRKQQGTIYFTDFEVYDCLPNKLIPLTGPKATCRYVRVGDAIANIPYGTTVAEFKSNMLNGDTITLTKNGRTLSDEQILTAGAKLTYNAYDFVWTVHTTFDINADGDIDLKDLSIAKECLNGKGTKVQYLSSDTDMDGSVSESDIQILRNTVLGGNSTVYTPPQTPTPAPTNGVGNLVTTSGKTIDVDVSIRNFITADSGIIALQIDLIWNDDTAPLIADSFTDYIGDKNTDIYTNFQNGIFSVIYECASSHTISVDSESDIFGIDVRIPADMMGVCMDFCISELSVIYSDGTSNKIISDKTAHIDVTQYGMNKQETADIPELSERTETYFTVDDKVGYEYSLDGINWTDNPRFKHLETGKTYTVYQRISENGNISVGDKSAPLYVTLYKRGDVNTNGDRDAGDLIIMKQFLLGINQDIDMFAANANLDRKVDIRDLIKLKKLIINPDDGWIDPTVRGEITIKE